MEDETEPNNYRPISLLSVFNNIFEKIMYKCLDKYLNMKNILCPSQYGFRQEHSTQHAILDIDNKIQTNMDDKLYSCGIFIDLKKAFDMVDHDILLAKLSHYGIREVVND
jgi:retron-type reverse transcriptase